jgi:hypothetical protein
MLRCGSQPPAPSSQTLAPIDGAKRKSRKNSRPSVYGIRKSGAAVTTL